MTPDHPPAELEEPLELTPRDWAPRQVYFLMTGLVIPRPIAWVSTLGPNGVRNLAPHSYFNVVTHDPPHIVFSSSGVKDTLANLRETGEFVINIVSADVVEQMNFTATDFPRDEDEFTWAELTTAPAKVVAPPRVAEAHAHLECKLTEVVSVGTGNLVIAEVVHIHIDPSVWRDGRVQPDLLDPVCRLAGTRYATLGDIFQLPRPSWDRDVAGTRPGEAIPRREPG
ncbi:MAG: flavin reductase family protein [Nitriliruptorales bacterium]|nr:flavin reductase family protein [Nitriliruptorales bacterium]